MKDNELYHSNIYLGQDYSDGIKHYKYIKKIPIGNGKYRYIYEINDKYNDANGKYEKIDGKNPSKYGTYTRTNKDGGRDEYIVKKSNKLFSEKTGSSFSLNNGPENRTTIHNVGLLRQGFDSFVKKNQKKINKAKNWLQKLFG